MRNRFRIYLVLTIVMMAFIFIQSALPGELSSKESNVLVVILSAILSADPMDISFGIRKCAHFTEYLALGLLLMLTVDAYRGWKKEGAVSLNQPGAAIIAWCIGTVYAGTDEFHQLFVTDRSGELRDVCIDSAGVLTGVLIGFLLFQIRRARRDGPDKRV